jgi:hypothetical protein
MEYAQLNQGPNKPTHSCANELGRLAMSEPACPPVPTTIRIMKHTDLPAGCTYVVGIKSH